MAPQQLAWLRALGVDVWVRRDLPVEPEVPAAPPANRERQLVGASAAAPEAVARPPAPHWAGANQRNQSDPQAVARPPAPAAEAPLRFTVQCFRHGNVFALVDESLWRHRRLLFDIARAMDASSAAKRENIAFEWPQLRSADAGMSAAGRAFRAFLNAQRTPDIRWLAVGSRVAELVGDEIDRAVHVFLGDDLEGLDKRGLWHEILGKR